MKKTFTTIIILAALLIGIVAGLGLAATTLVPNSIGQFLGTNQSSGYYNIDDYGAKADVSTFDNATIFNNIIQEIGVQGGTIYIPTGNYYIQSPIIVDRSYISIIGDNSGLRSGVDDATSLSQAGGGGAKLIAAQGITAIQIVDTQNTQRISGLTFRSFQIKGQENNGIGIQAIQDSDRIIIDDMVINNTGIGVQLHGADAPSIRNSWIAETHTSIVLNGASQQASIVNNSLGAQPAGTSIEMENAQWFNISGNTIYPDGASNIRLYNPTQGTIASNTITSYYNGMIELLPNKEGAIGSGNLINGNLISITKARTLPGGHDKNWGIIHLEADNTTVTGNLIISERMPDGYTGILVETGDNNRISSNSIGSTNPTDAKIAISNSATNTVVTGSVYEDEFKNAGDDSNVNQALPN